MSPIDYKKALKESEGSKNKEDDDDFQLFVRIDGTVWRKVCYIRDHLKELNANPKVVKQAFLDMIESFEKATGKKIPDNYKPLPTKQGRPKGA